MIHSWAVRRDPFLFLTCVAGVQTQGLAPATQALYHWAVSPAHSNLQSCFLSVLQLCLLVPRRRPLFNLGTGSCESVPIGGVSKVQTSEVGRPARWLSRERHLPSSLTAWVWSRGPWDGGTDSHKLSFGFRIFIDNTLMFVYFHHCVFKIDYLSISITKQLLFNNCTLLFMWFIYVASGLRCHFNFET